MALGAGKYDDLCALVRERAGISDGAVGGVVLIVIGGDRGNGVSMQADFITTLKLPDILAGLAEKIRDNGPF
jgi:hypothetical protein